jgi:hypothetical protein
MANKANKRALKTLRGKSDKVVPKGCKWYAWAKNSFFTRNGVKAVDVACASTGMQANCMKNAFAKSDSHSYANYNFKPKGIPSALAKKGLNIKVWNPRSNYLLGKCSSKKKY